MQKAFDCWNTHKKKIHADADRPFYHPREIWWCAVGVNVGNELDGTGKEHDRPVLVLRPFNAETFLASRSLVIRASAVSTSLLAKWKDRDAVANHSQVWLFDTKHLIRKMGTLDERAFRELAKALALTLFSVPGLEIICPA